MPPELLDKVDQIIEVEYNASMFDGQTLLYFLDGTPVADVSFLRQRGGIALDIFYYRKKLND